MTPRASSLSFALTLDYHVTRRSLRLPITLAIVMISLLVVLTVGWVLLNVFWALKSDVRALYWTLLSLGSTFIACCWPAWSST